MNVADIDKEDMHLHLMAKQYVVGTAIGRYLV